MNKLILLGSFVIICITTQGQFRKIENKKHTVNKVLHDLVTDESFKNAGLSFLAIDAKTGLLISSYQPDLALKPGSVLKLFTTATLLELAGPGFTFKTRLYHTGIIDTVNHILHGDIIIKGGGDPTLGSIYFDSTQNIFNHECVQAIKLLNIDSIDGQIIGDAGYFSLAMVPATWAWQNMGNYFGAGACGLTYRDNSYSITLESSGYTGEKPKIVNINPTVRGLEIINLSITDSIGYDNLNIFGSPFTNTRYLMGSMPLNQRSFKIRGSLPNPSLQLANEIQQNLANSGIACKDSATWMLEDEKSYQNSQQFVLLKSWLSPTLEQITEVTNKFSNNLFAEHCLLQVAVNQFRTVCTDTAAKIVSNFWYEKGMDIQGLSINDGSGLSHYNTLTPRQMVFVLKYMRSKSNFKNEFFQSLPVSGGDGTLKKVGLGTFAEGNLRAKSGTLDRSKCFAGYVQSVSGREIIFALMVNNYTCTTREASKKLEKLMVSLAEFEK